MSLPSGNTQTCGLLKVPPEILDRITWHLTTTEYCNLRLASKAIEQAVFFKFTSEFFTRKQFMVSEFSLRALIDISKSRLAGCLRHVHLGLDQLAPARGFADTDLQETIEAMRMHLLRLTEQETLWTLGLVPKYLAEAFAHLPKLETCVIRDFNSSRRSRDGPFCQWRSYGSPTLYKETKMHPMPQLGYPDYVDRLFKAVVHGLAMAQARPTAIEVMERHDHLLHDSAFHIHPDSEAAVAPVLGRLKRLHLSLDKARTPIHLARPSQAYHHTHLARFLRGCEDLEELRINGRRDFDTRGESSTQRHLFDWLATKPQTKASASSLAGGESTGQLPQDPALPGNDSTVPPAAKLARLKILSLGMTTFTVENLVRLIARFADTLESLDLWRIDVVSENKADDDLLAENGTILYARLLRELLNLPNLNLRHIKLGKVHQRLHPTRNAPITQEIKFKPEASTRDEDVDKGLVRGAFELEYTGSDWRHFVSHEMIPRLYTFRSKVPSQEEMELDIDERDEEGEDDNEDDDDDEDNDE
ncbi:hypothetical protein BBK36DRAFT_1165652 [Trichoderma citrinoviride]|uniref:F-box domain-containing protein n=1 Tax=Trichoderma citrinoviride TaxID=58853 RepID=A0A2T4BJA9_9HYPO|nr:hypothetical protein BBK36DRAFT_1165652 [Trichoderma citrinoviride]PTB69378.1 hypothetical protein BBK36DRAFT_1165652 [Trichoderma citrinoviride]